MVNWGQLVAPGAWRSPSDRGRPPGRGIASGFMTHDDFHLLVVWCGVVWTDLRDLSRGLAVRSPALGFHVPQPSVVRVRRVRVRDQPVRQGAPGRKRWGGYGFAAMALHPGDGVRNRRPGT